MSKPGKTKLPKVAVAALLAFLVLLHPVRADTLPDTDKGVWDYNFLFYAFLPASTKGTSTISGQSAKIDMNLGDVLELLKFVSSGRFEGWRGDFGYAVDAYYINLGDKGVLKGPGATKIKGDIEQFWLGLYGAYKAYEGSYGNNGRSFRLDLSGGIRRNYLKQKIDIQSPVASPTLGGSEGWWEPVIGARGVWVLNDRWKAIASVEFGGFGAGGNHLQIAANAGFEYSRWEKTSLVFGARYFSVDYSTTLSTGKMAFDVVQYGPVAGLRIRF